MSEVNYDKVPVSYMLGSVRSYIENGFMSGSFLTALFSNDLVGVYNKGDKANTKALDKWVTFLFCYAPRGCWGSKERVLDWMDKGGLNGIQGKEESDESIRIEQ